MNRVFGGGAIADHVVRGCCHPFTGEVNIPTEPLGPSVMKDNELRVSLGDFPGSVIYSWTYVPAKEV
jgi:hypothetical protein